jgi:hypothetical protein
MDADNGAWNKDFIRSVFEEDVAAQIMKIPISRHGGPDFASWPHNKYGVYTVRSAYNLARVGDFNYSRSLPSKGLTSDMETEAKCWKKLWVIVCPGKMKVTLWRFAHDCLPSGQQLARRNIPASSACVYYERFEEATHCMLFCPFADAVWT